MSDNKFLEDSVLALTAKVDKGFSTINERLNRQDIMLAEHKMLLVTHTQEDTTAQNRVNALEGRLEVLEKPVKWVRGSAWLVASVATVSTAIVAIRKLFGFPF